jgi:hypothetical protein
MSQHNSDALRKYQVILQDGSAVGVSSVIPAHRFVKRGTPAAMVFERLPIGDSVSYFLASNGDSVVGVTEYDSTLQSSVGYGSGGFSILTSGLVYVEVGSTVNTGDQVQSDSLGRAVPVTGNGYVAGVAYKGAGIAGQIIPVLLTNFAASTAVTIPAVTTADNGKLLQVVSGAWTKATFTGLPTVTTADNGKVLTVTSGAWAATAPTVSTSTISVTYNNSLAGPTVTGNSARGSVSWNTGGFAISGVTINHTPNLSYAATPIVTITPLNATTANALPYVSYSGVSAFILSFAGSSTSTGVNLSYNYTAVA